MQLTFLGTGSAIPIPRHQRKFDPSTPLHDCPQCQSKDPRDRRWPSALLLDSETLIDAGPNIVELLHSIQVDPRKISTVLLTHRHRDAAGGVASLGKGVRVLFPSHAGTLEVNGHTVEAVNVPHDSRTWGYLVDGKLAYFSDYADIQPAIPILRRAQVAVLDGSGWERAYPTHQPMIQVIPFVKGLSNLKRIFFTHIGHIHFPHSTLERKTRTLGDDRFSIAYHGLEINLR